MVANLLLATGIVLAVLKVLGYISISWFIIAIIAFLPWLLFFIGAMIVLNRRLFAVLLAGYMFLSAMAV